MRATAALEWSVAAVFYSSFENLRRKQIRMNFRKGQK